MAKQWKQWVALSFLWVLTVGFVGCSDMTSEGDTSEENSGGILSAIQEEEVNDDTETPDPEAAQETVSLKKADVGATGKGNWADSAEKPMSIITVPLSSYFKAQEMTVFRIQIPQAMNLYQASNGRYPHNQDEFMREIIQANMIQLPTLPSGDEYLYDPNSHELMIKTISQK